MRPGTISKEHDIKGGIFLSQKKSRKREPRLRVIPLGGLGEIGKNMTVFEYGDDIIVVDLGSMFPKEDMPGVDLVIPDLTYLEKNRERILGYVITHGHEDHIGAAPYVLKDMPAPLYGTRLTLALVAQKLKEHRYIEGVEMNVVEPGDTISLGAFKVEFIKVNHSIAGACALAIHTPVGTVVHTGDFKVDYTPVDGKPIDLGRFAELGKKGVLLLMADSTNAERVGFTMSEKKVCQTLDTLFDRAQGRIIIAMFASNIHRIQSVVDSAVRYGRKVCMIGRSMVNIAKAAMQLGDLKIPEGRLVNVDDIDRYEDNEICVLTTGSQGEPMSGLSRMAFAEHRKLEIRSSDMVIVSASPIPGNEKSVSRVINQLVRTGADVIYEALAEVHVSGHARQEELKLMHTLVRPKFFMPVHGEYRHLYHHARLPPPPGVPPPPAAASAFNAPAPVAQSVPAPSAASSAASASPMSGAPSSVNAPAVPVPAAAPASSPAPAPDDDRPPYDDYVPYDDADIPFEDPFASRGASPQGAATSPVPSVSANAAPAAPSEVPPWEDAPQVPAPSGATPQSPALSGATPQAPASAPALSPAPSMATPSATTLPPEPDAVSGPSPNPVEEPDLAASLAFGFGDGVNFEEVI